MDSVYFFNPVYIVPDSSKPQGEGKVPRISFGQKIINFAESTFAVGKAYKISKIDESVTQFVTKYRDSRLLKLVRLALVVTLVASAVLFPPLLPLLTIALPSLFLTLFLIKLFHRQGTNFVENDDPNEGDAQFAKKICEDDLDLLKEDGPLFQKCFDQINEINRNTNSQAGATLYARLSNYQAHYASLLDLEGDNTLNEKIYEVIESLGRLKCGIDYKIRGIINVGNSCYINSAMQALLTIPDINHKLANLEESKFAGNKRLLAVAVKKFTAAYNLDFAPEEAIFNAAEEIQQALLKKGIILPAPDKCKELEADIKALEAEVLGDEEKVGLEARRAELRLMKAAGINYAIKGQGEPADFIYEVMDLIGNTIPMTLKCRAISNDADLLPNIKNTAASSLNITLNENDRSSFKDLLKKHFAPKVEGEGRTEMIFDLNNGYQEKKIPRWTEEIRMKGEPPAYLVVHLQRHLDGGRRAHSTVDLKAGEAFDLGEYFEGVVQSAVYEPCAAIVHKGDAQQGHYYAIRKDAESNWYECNDLEFKKLGKQETEEHLGLGSIYILQRKAPEMGITLF